MSPINAFRTGFGLLVAAALSYLAAIWTSETTSGHFALTGVVFMVSGVAALIAGGVMSAIPSLRSRS